ncbi:MAG: RagB/SusD family nutrient uptake outer membrane protein [Muribaculaceae bacterium]|nr:RagB/SusD family nutrient uptake outer membrane protein [Muribaculaceae bacterium]
MKSYNKILAVLLSGAMLAGCNDLDVLPQGSTVTEEQKNDVLNIDPSKILASVSGIAGQFTAFGSLSGGAGSDAHWDIGIPGVLIRMDLRGMDEYSITSGYNWFGAAEAFTDGLPSGQCYVIYEYCYNIIRACNDVIKSQAPNIDLENPNDNTNTVKFYVAQASAFRAYAYLYLAQSYAFTYDGNQTAPCVPLITEENMEKAAAEGEPRATVQQIYDQIMADLDRAVAYLDNNPVTPDKVIESKPKRFVSLAAAYGLRARANLLMHKWAEAASDAENAIVKSGARPLSIEEAGRPGFNNINASNWIWGIAVAETDRVVTTGICNFPSHMGSFGYGYASAVGAWKWISKNLYDRIPTLDIRKGWWLGEDGTSANLTDRQNAFMASHESDPNRIQRIQVKFDSYQSVLNTQTNACDVPLMRVEEMYLVRAEALGMQDVAQGVAALSDFVKTNRFQRYRLSATTVEDFLEELWFQRRIELWGEGFSYYDMLRFKKDLDRVGGGWPATCVYQIPATDPLLIYPLPSGVITTNPYISEADNTMGGGRPTPVEDDTSWKDNE